MSLSVKNLNGDTTFLLTFAPANPPDGHNDKCPDAFSILVDPWLTGPSSVWNTRFQISHHTIAPVVSSLRQLAEPDVILISQAKPDHCHRETLCTLPPDTRIPILAIPAAAKLIKSWGYFSQPNVITIKPYSTKGADNVHRIPLKPHDCNAAAGEMALSFITEKYDMTGLHNAIGMTYRAPGASTGNFFDQSIARSSSTPDSPMAGQLSPDHLPPASSSTGRPVSVLYTPHGLSYPTLAPYIKTHLAPLNALPLTALFHSITVEQNPRIMGGLVARGFPGGQELIREIGAQYWIGSHDEAKDNKGWATTWIKSRPYTVEEAQGLLDAQFGQSDGAAGTSQVTKVLELGVGEEIKT